MNSAWLHYGYTDDYVWTTSNANVALTEMVQMFPSMVLHRVLAVTSWDSGPLQPTETERSLGWSAQFGIAYSPILKSLSRGLMGEPDPVWPEYSECYILPELRELGREFDRDLYEFDSQPGELLMFVNFPGFALHDETGPTAQLSRWFWQQFDWVKPEGYFAESDTHLTVVHRDRLLMGQVRTWLSHKPAR